MRILVTGAAGFIGSNFVRWLFLQDNLVEQITVLDSLTYAGNLANLEAVLESPSLRFVRGDIRDAEIVESILEDDRIDAIINFAAESHVDRSILDPLAFVRTNVEGTQVLLRAAQDKGIKRFLQVSTDEVYGSLGETGKFLETTPLDPSSAYSASKASADLLVLAAYKTHGYDVCVTRCTNNYGPFQFPEKFIPLFVTNALHDQALPMYGDGKNVRSWLHVDDHSRAIWAVLKGGKAGEVYNVGGTDKDEKPNIEVAEQILSVLGKPSSLITFVEDRKGHDRRYAVDFSKINNELGWAPQVSFEDGLRETVNWYVENVEWWQSVKSGDYQRFYDTYYGKRLAAG
jgi:dTDP-glucose 4,6-dehydratase